MILRSSFVPSVLLATVFAVGLLSAGCTSSTSSDVSADSTMASAATTVSEKTSAPDPAAPVDIEKAKNNRSVGQKIEDASMETRVKQALIHTSSLRVFPFRPTVIEGHLVLRGDVNTSDQYHTAERVAERVEGITAVTNRLTMGGQPVTEERLNSDDGSASDEGAAVYHTVRQGDTLWDIARKYRASVEQIRNLNDFRSPNLRPGQRIRVR